MDRNEDFPLDTSNSVQETVLVVIGVLGAFLFAGLGFAGTLSPAEAFGLFVASLLVVAISDRTLRYEFILMYHSRKRWLGPQFGKIWLHHH